MSKKALLNFATGDTVIEQGKIYSDEDVKDLDPSKFEDVSDETNSVPATGTVGDEAKETIEPELDTDSVEEEKKNSDESVEQVA